LISVSNDCSIAVYRKNILDEKNSKNFEFGLIQKVTETQYLYALGVKPKSEGRNSQKEIIFCTGGS
jgi:hypothetical protein